jgi:ADP-heptose:LPS heptosyltransferase/GT2 family glycosyltransferase
MTAHKLSDDHRINSIQIYDEAAVRHFVKQVGAERGVIAGLRREFARTGPGPTGVYFDVMIHAPKAGISLILLAIRLDEGDLVFPKVAAHLPSELLSRILQRVSTEMWMTAANQHVDLRLFDKTPFNRDGLLIGRAIPGLIDYGTAVNHLKRYTFARDHLQPGSVLDCASGAGYGASILLQNTEVSRYLGVDIDAAIVDFSRTLCHDPRADFHAGDLAQVESLFDNVVSLETIEHVPDPEVFLELLKARLVPGGRLILSLPVERWGGSYLNQEHLTNWTYGRFRRLVDPHFADVEIYRQRLSLLGPDVFSASEIHDGEVNLDEDEGYIAILSSPRVAEKRNRVVLHRTHAVGDVIWTTPIVASARQLFPDAVIAVSTACTEVFQGNPHADIVATQNLARRSDDLWIDFTGAYEERRAVHILQAYAERFGHPLSDVRPRLYPAPVDYRQAWELVRAQGWKDEGVEYIVALHMAATSPDRIWPIEHWRQFVSDLLENEKIGVLLLGANRDFDGAALNLPEKYAGRVASLVGRLSLMGTASAVALADVLVGPDSGLSHVAAAMGTRLVCLYGMARPDTRLPLDGSGAGVWSPVPCRGCLDDIPPDRPPVCKFVQSTCMQAITPESVLAPVVAMLAQAPGNNWRRRLESCIPELRGHVLQVMSAPARTVRIAVVTREGAGSAAAQTRLVRPLQGSREFDLSFLLHCQGAACELDEAALRAADIVLVQGSLPHDVQIKIFDAARAFGNPVVVELDNWPAGDQNELLETMLGQADWVVCATRELANRVRMHNARLSILPTLVDFDVVQRSIPEPQSTVRIGVVVGGDTGTDRQLLENLLMQAVDRYGNQVRFVIIGDSAWLTSELRNLEVKPLPEAYTDYIDTLQAASLDIALDPLSADDCNRARSNIRWLEYSALGLAGVYSEAPPYACVEHEVTGLKVRGEADAWLEAIDELISQPEKRREIAATAQAVVRREYSLERKAGMYATTYHEILGQQGRKAKPPAVASAEAAQKKPVSVPAVAAQSYEAWIGDHEPGLQDADQIAVRMATLTSRPVFHLALIVLHETLPLLGSTIKSLSQQIYPDMRLTFVAEMAAPEAFSNDDKVLWVQSAPDQLLAQANKAFAEVPADWVGMIEAGDQLSPYALLTLAEMLNRHPEWLLVYSDEDSLDTESKRSMPFFKSDFDLELLRAAPFALGGLMMLNKPLFQTLGGYQPELEGAESYDLALRAWEQAGTSAMGHLAEILYHRFVAGGHSRRSAEIIQVARRVALDEHLLRLGISAELMDGLLPGTTRVRYRHNGEGMVSIVIPTKNAGPYVQRCLNTIRDNTDYKNTEIIIVDQGSDEAETLAVFNRIDGGEWGTRAKVMKCSGATSLPTMINSGARAAQGQYLLLLADAAGPLQSDWLDDLLGYMAQPDVGVVGLKMIGSDTKVSFAGYILGLDGRIAGAHDTHQPIDAPGYFGRLLLPNSPSAISAACLLTRKQLFDGLGGFDEAELANDSSDVDYCLKVWQSGNRVVWTPYSVMLLEHAVEPPKGESLEDAESEGKRAKVLYLPSKSSQTMLDRWRDRIAFDPAYNQNLSLTSGAFELETISALTWNPECRPLPRVFALPADRWGCGEYRIIAPLRALVDAGRIQGLDTNDYLSVPELFRISPDAVIFQRQIKAVQIKLMEMYRRNSKAFHVFELDDLLTNIQLGNFARKKLHHKDLIKIFRQALNLCDRFVVSTENLAEEYSKYKDDIVVVQNRLERAKWGGLSGKRRQGRKPRVGWAGSQTHEADLAIIADVVKALKDDVEWVFMALQPKGTENMVEFHAGVPIEEYPAKLANLNLDLALAPLEDVPFNHAKSHLRLLEYGALGFPVICTDITPYRGAYPVTRVKNRFKDWVDAIREHVSDMDELARRGDTLCDYINANWMLEDNLDTWLKAWLPS